MAKRLRTSLVQREILFAFMHAHEDFARNQLTGPNAEKIKQVLLKKLTQQLNSTGTGVVKTPDKWVKCWQDWKADVKAKYSRIKTFENTKFNKDEEVHVPCPLSELEEKVLQFLDVDVVVEEDLNERQKRMSFSQRELMLEIMEAHKEVALNLLIGPDRTENKKVLLNELAEELNALGPAIKSSEKWFKCWQDWKSDVKAKDLKIKIFNQKKVDIGDDVSPPCPLSYLEEKLLKFLDVDKVELKVIVVKAAEVPKDKRVSLAQREMMFAFMQTHEDFGKNQITGPNATKIKKALLNKLTKQLNASGPATKSPEKWLRCWQDWKSDTKAKWQKLKNFKQTEAIMHDYVRSPCPLTQMEQKVVDFFGFGKTEGVDESEALRQKKVYPSVQQKLRLQELVQADVELRNAKFTDTFTKKESERRWRAIGAMLNSMPGCIKCWSEWRKTWQDKKSTMKKRALKNPVRAADIPDLLPPTQTNMTVPETPVPGPSSTQESGVNIEDIFQAGGSTIKEELEKLDTSDSDDPLNFEEEYLVSDPASPEPEPEPEIEQPKNTARDRSRRRFRRVLRRPLTYSRLDVINHITVNEVKKALIQKNEIKKQFYAQYMVEIRKQTQALVSIAKRLLNNR